MDFCKFHISFVMAMCYHLRGGGQSLWGGDYVVVFLLPTQTEVSKSVDPTQECPGTGGIRLGPGVSCAEVMNWPLTSGFSNGSSRNMPSVGQLMWSPSWVFPSFSVGFFCK